MKRLKGVLARVALLVVSFALSLGFGEALIRVIAPQQLVQTGSGVWQPDETGVGHRRVAGLDRDVSFGERTVRLRTNASGHRISPDGEHAARRRVLALGDSFVEALSIPYPETVTGRLEIALERQLDFLEPVQVVNTGVSGYGPSHYAIVAERELRRSRYDAVVVFLYVINDVTARRRRWFPPQVSDSVREIGWPKELSAQSVVSSVLHPLYAKLRDRSHLAVFLKRQAAVVLARLGLTTSGLLASALRTSYRRSGDWEAAANILAEIARGAERHGAASLVVLIPAHYQVNEEAGSAAARARGFGPGEFDLEQPSRIFSESLRTRGVETIDALPELRRRYRAGQELYGSVDRHLSPEGHGVLAELLAPRLGEIVRAAAIADSRTASGRPDRTRAAPGPVLLPDVSEPDLETGQFETP